MSDLGHFLDAIPPHAEPCRCQQCAAKHGDQAEDPVEAGLRAQLGAAKRERDAIRNQRNDLITTLRAVADLIGLGEPANDWAAICEDPSLVLRLREIEREECAKLVDLWPAVGSTSDIAHSCWAIAAAIRARGGR